MADMPNDLRNEPCLSCGEPSTLLCDFVLGFSLYATLPFRTTDGEQMYTCDAPLCRACARFGGNVFYDGSKAMTGVESRDFCPGHDGESNGTNPITAADADYLRRQWWSKVRRAAMKLAP